jgi:hypothetical protein
MIDLTCASNPRAVHIELLRFVIGLGGEPRQHPVTRKQIASWLHLTPAWAVDRAMVDLIAEGKVLPVTMTRTKVGYQFNA